MSKICLNMIVKNESHIIYQTLKNLCEKISFSYWVISDTGSTDNTCEIIKKFFKEKKINGELLHHEWKNFSYNRNKALEACLGKSEYILFFDADDALIGNPNIPEKLTADAYYFNLSNDDNNIIYHRKILIKNNNNFYWKGVLHEFIENRIPITEEFITGEYSVISRRTGSRNKDPIQKYKNDANILVKAFNSNLEPELNPRYAYYAAQSFHDAGDIKNAKKWLHIRSEMIDGWIDERYMAYLRLGFLAEHEGNHKKAIQYWIEASELCPELAEAWYHIARLYHWNKQYELAYSFALCGVRKKLPTTTRLYVFKDIYQLWLPYEVSILAYELGNYKESFLFFKKIIDFAPIHIIEQFKDKLEKYRPYIVNENPRTINNIIKKLNNLGIDDNLLKNFTNINEVTTFDLNILDYIDSLKKHILFVHPFLNTGGSETILINYLNIAASNINYEVTLILLECEKDRIEQINERVNIIFINNEIESQFERLSYWKSINSENSNEKDYYKSWHNEIINIRNKRFESILDRCRFDYIINFNIRLDEFTLNDKIYSKMQNIPIIRWIHGQGYLDMWINNYIDFNKILFREHTFVSICNDMKKICDHNLETIFNLKNKNSVMIYNPIDFSRIKELSENISDSDEELLNAEFILNVARLQEEHKNHSEMIDIYYQLKQRGIKQKLYIIGYGPSQKMLEEKIRTLGLEKDCLLLGKKLNPYPFMKNAKLFIHTSNWEGLPTVFIESMSLNTPVVAFDCPTGPREVLSDGKYGVLVPMHNQEIFIEKVLELTSDETIRQKYINLLPESIERFSIQNISKQFFELLNNINK